MKRYVIRNSGLPEEMPNGEWVKYEDCKRLELKLKVAIGMFSDKQQTAFVQKISAFDKDSGVLAMKKVSGSSNIAAVGFIEDKLFITFHGGKTYEYLDVPVGVHEEFMKAESLGKYFIANIKKGNYKYRLL